MSFPHPSLPGDYHTHTWLCKHAEGSPLDYVRAGLSLGLESVAVTDHLPSPHNYDPEHRMEMTQAPDYLRLVEEARAFAPERVLLGWEADYYQGCHTFQSEFLRGQTEVDVVLGSVHFQCFWAAEESEKGLFGKSETRRVWTRYFKLVALAAESKLYDVIAHFDLPKRKGDQPDEGFLREAALPALNAIYNAKLAIEINTSGLRHPVAEFYPGETLLRMARERDIPIVFGSDAHHPDDTGRDFAAAVAFARKAGYTERAVFERRIRRMTPI